MSVVSSASCLSEAPGTPGMARLARLAAALALLSALALAQHCARLDEHKIARRWAQWPRVVAHGGRERRLALACGSGPACAGAELLRAALVRLQHYRNVSVLLAGHALHSDVPYAGAEYDQRLDYELVVASVSAAWAAQRPARWRDGHTGGLAAPRLLELGASSVPARRRLFAWLRPGAPERRCNNTHTYSFYAATANLLRCYFINDTRDSIPVYVVNDPADELPANEQALQALEAELQARAAAAAVRLRPQRCSRAQLLARMGAAERSLLFLDHDVWGARPGVRAVLPPPCAPAAPAAACHHELDPSVGLRLADEVLKYWAPELFKYMHAFTCDARHIWDIITTNETSAEEAACRVIYDDIKSPDSEFIKLRWNMYRPYTAVVFMCLDDGEQHLYSDFLKNTGLYIYKSKTTKSYVGMAIIHKRVNCSDNDAMHATLHDDYTTTAYQMELMGVLVPGGRAARRAASLARVSRVPLLAYGAADEPLDAWLLRPRRLPALALAHFIRVNGWTRVAVLSEDSSLARGYVEDLRNASLIVHDVRLHSTRSASVLSELRSVNARIIFVNADSTAAAAVLMEALEQKMSDDEEYVWIVREWHPDDATRLNRTNGVLSQLRLFTVSATWRYEGEVPAGEGDERLRQAVTAGAWPRRHGMAIVDGLWLLINGFEEVFRREPSVRNDMRSDLAMRTLETSLYEKPVIGTSQRYEFKNRALVASRMYLEEWRGERRTLLAALRVNATARSVTPEPRDARADPRGAPPAGALPAPPPDGARACLLAGAGDPFAPPCYDWAWGCGLVALAVAPLLGWLVHCHVRSRLERRDQKLLMRLLARHDLIAATLADWLVDRSALHVRDEIGAGQFGRVHLAILRVPGRATRVVAAKALHDGASPAEESDFLREACTLASLDHPHVLRLIGVCVDGGPPLMLTEVAFFGDLHKYLCERRHFLEDDSVDPTKDDVSAGEAAHVSAEALTRLAREAAAALAYLASRGMVHRDVRAANCFVDSTRSLKLGDFGMARETGAQEYVCVRRTLVPVRWMAPESLAHGVFSSASDVWALGVLVLEVMTLGARPFGGMALQSVPEYVSRGGRAPLPRDASPEARALSCLCWRREPAARPSAAGVQAYLREHPRALRPALAPERGAADTDSGCEEPSLPDVLPIRDSFLSINSLLHDSTDKEFIKYH